MWEVWEVWKREGGEWEVWEESGESLAPLSSPSSPPSPSSEGRSSLSLSQQITFLTEQYCNTNTIWLTIVVESREFMGIYLE